jgi:peroxiredoxin
MATEHVQNGVETYNYKSFSRSESAGKSNEFKNSLRAGDDAPDFELPTLQGERVRLSNCRGSKHVLLEFGSIT